MRYFHKALFSQCMNSIKRVNEVKRIMKLMFLLLACVLILSMSEGARASPETKVAVQPAEVSDIPPNETFNVNVTITDVSELYSWQFTLTFNQAVLNVIEVTEGPFLKAFNETIWLTPKKDNDAGLIGAGALLKPPAPPHGASGSGVLASVTFKVVSGGTSSLHFDKDKTILMTYIGTKIVRIENFLLTDGSFRNTASAGVFGIPLEFLAGAIAVVAIVSVSVFFFIRRRRKGMLVKSQFLFKMLELDVTSKKLIKCSWFNRLSC